jgi:hypothetical protein
MSRWRVLVRENWYRDVWLLIITGVTLIALINASAESDRIQAQRVDTIRAVCEAQNARNAATIATLRINARETVTPAALARTQQLFGLIGIHATLRGLRRFELLSASNEQTIHLINALAPRQNCQSVVRLATTLPAEQ